MLYIYNIALSYNANVNGKLRETKMSVQTSVQMSVQNGRGNDMKNDNGNEWDKIKYVNFCVCNRMYVSGRKMCVFVVLCVNVCLEHCGGQKT